MIRCENLCTHVIDIEIEGAMRKNGGAVKMKQNG